MVNITIIFKNDNDVVNYDNIVNDKIIRDSYYDDNGSIGNIIVI